MTGVRRLRAARVDRVLPWLVGAGLLGLAAARRDAFLAIVCLLPLVFLGRFSIDEVVLDLDRGTLGLRGPLRRTVCAVDQLSGIRVTRLGTACLRLGRRRVWMAHCTNPAFASFCQELHELAPSVPLTGIAPRATHHPVTGDDVPGGWLEMSYARTSSSSG